MLKKNRPEAGQHGEAVNALKIVHPRKGIETDEFLLEVEDRSFETMPGGAHGFGPIGDRRRGKMKVSAKSRILKK